MKILGTQQAPSTSVAGAGAGRALCARVQRGDGVLREDALDEAPDRRDVADHLAGEVEQLKREREEAWENIVVDKRKAYVDNVAPFFLSHDGALDLDVLVCGLDVREEDEDHEQREAGWVERRGLKNFFFYGGCAYTRNIRREERRHQQVEEEEAVVDGRDPRA